MKSKHIAIVDPAMNTPELDCYNTLSLTSRIATTYHLPAMHGISSLTALESPPAGIVVLGSFASVLEKSLWQSQLVHWLEAQWKDNVPTLAICYGHQLVAQVFGAKVGFVRPNKEKLLGARQVKFKSNRLWKTQTGPLAVSHREVVQDCPKNMKSIASSDAFEYEALEHETLPIWTLQPHPEATERFMQIQKIEAPAETLAFGHQLVGDFITHCGG